MQLDRFFQLLEFHRKELNEEFSFLTDWEVSLDNAIKRAGYCNLTHKKISVSKRHIHLNEDVVVVDTLLHEFAHAIAYELYQDRGHGVKWKSIARKIGATPKATGRFNLPDAPWLLVVKDQKAQTLKKVATRHRRNKNIKRYFLSNQPHTQGRLYYVTTSEFNRYLTGELSISQLKLVQ